MKIQQQKVKAAEKRDQKHTWVVHAQPCPEEGEPSLGHEHLQSLDRDPPHTPLLAPYINL